MWQKPLSDPRHTAHQNSDASARSTHRARPGRRCWRRVRSAFRRTTVAITMRQSTPSLDTATMRAPRAARLGRCRGRRLPTLVRLVKSTTSTVRIVEIFGVGVKVFRSLGCAATAGGRSRRAFLLAPVHMNHEHATRCVSTSPKRCINAAQHSPCIRTLAMHCIEEVIRRLRAARPTSAKQRMHIATMATCLYDADAGGTLPNPPISYSRRLMASPTMLRNESMRDHRM